MTLTLPYTFINGTVADANQVDANFNAIIASINSNQRTRLSANTTFYVAPTGSDSGIPTSPTSPAATIQYVLGLLENDYDLNGFTVTIQLADGTYNQSTTIKGKLLGQLQPNNLTIQGNLGSPANVVVVGDSCFLLNNLGMAQLQGMRLTSPSDCIDVAGFSQVNYQAIDFGTTTQSHVRARRGGLFLAIGNYSISGSAQRHWDLGQGYGHCEQAVPIHTPPTLGIPTVTLTGTPNFSAAFAFVSNVSFMRTAASFVGTATGPRYNIQGNAVIDTFGQSTTYLPGDTAGTTSTGGQYV